ncbi:MAG: T9SS type A sorting domain-containing protein, partial [candidate division Zixibacteria bacterium]|nr:T9SS type A sorting domain-containing protein [candidate division Zixibacteria bacterium]
VYDLLGRKVITLISGTLPAGRQAVNWNGLDAAGAQVASGMYLYVLKVDGETYSKYMTLVK